MEVIETASDGLRRELDVTVPSSDLEEPTNRELVELGKAVRIPGFRPGKVPLRVLRRRFLSSIRNSVVSEVLNKSVQKVVEEKGFDPVEPPTVNITRNEDGEDLQYNLIVDLKPEIAPIDFSALKLERLVANISDEVLESELEQVALAHREYSPVAGREAEMGDQILFDSVLSVNGEPVSGREVTDQIIVLNSEQLLPEYLDQLLGSKAGDKRDLEAMGVKETEDDSEPEGTVHSVVVKEVRKPEPIELNDEFAKRVNYESLDDLRTGLQQLLAEKHDKLSFEILKSQMVLKIQKDLDFDVPKGMHEKQVGVLQSTFERNKRDGTLEEEFEDKSEEEMKEYFVELAKKQVRQGLFFLDVASKNGLEASEQEVNLGIRSNAHAMGVRNEDQVISFVNNANIRDQVMYELTQNKVMEYILELADVTDRTVSPEELKLAETEVEKQLSAMEASDPAEKNTPEPQNPEPQNPEQQNDE